MPANKNIRNFGFIAHIDAGKTTTTERVLYLSGINHRIGEVDSGTTTTDWMDEERERGITITSAAVNCQWNGVDFHIIDTPGHVDFTAEVQRSLRVLDGAVVIFCGVSGVQTQSETVWKQADKYKIPRIVFINKLDRVGADFEAVAKEINKKLSTRTVFINIPVYEKDKVIGIINLISMKFVTYNEKGEIDETSTIPSSAMEMAENFREELINILSEYNDEVLEAAINNTLTEEKINNALRISTINRNFVAISTGSSLKNIGIPQLMDAIANYLPKPSDLPHPKGFLIKKDQWHPIPLDASSSSIAYIFKVQSNKEKGPLCFVRIYSGTIKKGDVLYNGVTKKSERIHDILQIKGDRFTRIEQAIAGDIVIFVGLKFSRTSDTLCTQNNQVLLEKMTFPEPVIYSRIEPKNTIDANKLDEVIKNLVVEDPTIQFKNDSETGQLLVGGMGELHIEIVVERIKREYGIELKVGTPQVVYREMPKQSGLETYNFDKKIQGNVQHATITLAVEPSQNTNVEIVSKLPTKSLNDELFDYIRRGLKTALQSGPESAYPVINAKLLVQDVEYDQSRSTPEALEAAANLCAGFLFKKVGMYLLQPIMKLTLEIPTEYTGSVLGELQSRNGIILNVTKKYNIDTINAHAPLKSLFGYSTVLRSLTQGHGSFNMEFFEFNK